MSVMSLNFRLGLPRASVVVPVLALAALLGLSACKSVPEKTAMEDSGAMATAQPQPLSTPGSYLAGMHAERRGESSAAGDFLLHALEVDKENLGLLNRAYLLMIEEGREADSIVLAERILKLNPVAALPILSMAIRDVKAGDLKGAESRLETIPKKGFNKFFAPLMIAWVLAGQDRLEDALKALEPLSENSGFSVLKDMHTGLIQDFSGHSEEAEESFLAAMTSGLPTSFRLVEIFGTFFERVGRREKAQELYTAFLKANADGLLITPALERLENAIVPEAVIKSTRDGMAEALFNIASALHLEGAYKMALVYSRLALDLRPDFSIVQALIAEILEGQGRREASIAMFEMVKPDSPYHWMASLRIALNLEALSRHEEAAQKLRAMSVARPERTDALVTLGDILRSQDKFEEAVAAYDEALERIGKIEKRHWALLYARGIALERSKEWRRAETDFLKALELEPEQPYVLNYLGYSWVEQGLNLDKARRMIERAVELKPGDGYIIDSLGWVLYQLGEFETAVTKLEKAVELRPQDSTINDHLGDAYWRAGRRSEARFQWQRVMNMDPPDDLSAVVQRKLEHGLDPADNGS